MKKTTLVLMLVFPSYFAQTQVNVISSTDGSLIITPKGIRGKLPNDQSQDANNIAIGDGALKANTKSMYNIAIGKNALSTLSFNNAGVPYDAPNIAIGYESLMSNQTLKLEANIIGGYYNTAVGTRSLRDNTSGGFNSAFGNNALRANTTGMNNSAFGAGALDENQSSNNSAFGSGALGANLGGFDNAAFGILSLGSNTGGYQNTAIGSGALFSNKANIGSVAVGYNAMYNADNRTVGVFTNNTAIGYKAMEGSAAAANNTGIGNTAIGTSTLKNYTSGSNNTVLGYNSGNAVTTGSGNTMLGKEAGGTVNVSNKLFIANSNTNNPLIKGDFSTQELKVNGALKVGGTTDAPEAQLDVDGNVHLGTTAIYDGTTTFDPLNPSGKSHLFLNGTGTYTLNGITAPTSSSIDGFLLYISSGSTTTVILKENNAAVGANKIYTHTGSDVTITGRGGATLMYSTGAWRIIGIAQ